MNEDVIKKISRMVDEVSPELKELSKKIHDNPELGNEEFKACKWQEELLDRYGFEIEHAFCGIPTAYKATFRGKKSGPKLATLSEYDALPDLGHACGHNLIAMVSVGAGLVIKNLVEAYGGEISVIGTPAEETAGAKIEMSRKGAFDDYDAVMMAHPFACDAEALDTMAIISKKFEFFGKPAHAAAYPEEGLNALDAVVSFYNMVSMLRQQTKSDARIHGIISNGGSAANVIPEYTEARYNIRSNRMKDALTLTERVEACARAAAAGTGTEVKISSYDEDFMDTCSNRVLSELICEQMESLGHKMERFKDKTVPGSSDVGDVSYRCPAAQMSMNMGPVGRDNGYIAHTHEFEQQAGSELAMENGLDFVRGFAMTAYELLTCPEHLERIKKEFELISEI